MWEWYRIGLALGLGVGIGVIVAGIVAPTKAGLAGAAVIAGAAGAGVGFALQNWDEALAGGIGGVLGALVAGLVARGTIARGGTRGGTAILMGVAGLAVAALALVPLLGYALAAGTPYFGSRMRKGEAGRFAGLRILAKD